MMLRYMFQCFTVVCCEGGTALLTISAPKVCASVFSKPGNIVHSFAIERVFDTDQVPRFSDARDKAQWLLLQQFGSKCFILQLT